MEKQSKTSWANVHFMPQRIRQPVDPIRICLVGAGGTGSQVAMGLARINYSLINMNHPGLEVFIFDPDDITGPNVGRQLFAESEIGMNKALAITTRINRFFGFAWQAESYKYTGQRGNILITCIDSVKDRWKIKNLIVKHKGNAEAPALGFRERQYYWIDTGNDFDFGQIVMGSCNRFKQPTKESVKWLSNVFDLHPDFNQVDREDEPSCSIAQALGKQDLFINSIIANYTCHLTWKILTQQYLDYHAIYVNLQTLQTRKRKL